MAGIPIDSPKPTDLQVARGRGETDAFDRLVPVVHDELRRIARRCMGRERPGHALQLTALVNEAYLRLIEAKRVRWQNRAHFFAMSAWMMGRIWWTLPARVATRRGVAAARECRWTRP
jgi:hypothetical protein